MILKWCIIVDLLSYLPTSMTPSVGIYHIIIKILITNALVWWKLVA